MESWLYQISFSSQDAFNQSNVAFMNFLKFIDCYSAFGKEYQIGNSSFGKLYLHGYPLVEEKGFKSCEIDSV